MNTIHQGFFHFLMSAKVCSKETALEVLGGFNCANQGEDVSMKDCIEAVNATIKRYDLEIVEGKSEITGNEVVALVQICENNIAESVKLCDKKAAALFSKLLSKITLSTSGFMPETTAVNLNSEVGMSKSAAQLAVQDFINQKWLEEKDGKIYLGVRSVLEVGQLLATNYPEAVKQCTLCKNNLFYGLACAHCQCKGHIHCLQKYFERTRSCPSCKRDWPASASCDDEDSIDIDVSMPKRPRLS